MAFFSGKRCLFYQCIFRIEFQLKDTTIHLTPFKNKKMFLKEYFGSTFKSNQIKYGFIIITLWSRITVPLAFFHFFFEKVTKLWKITSPGKQVKFVFHDSLHSNIPSNRIVQINLLRKIYSILLRKVSIVLIQHISKIFVSFKPYGPRQTKILSPVYSDRHRLIDFAIFCNPTVN